MLEKFHRYLPITSGRPGDQFLWLVVVGILGLPLIGLDPARDVFESSLSISPDGVDYVLQGRALCQDIGGERPVLRNPGMVVVSQIDCRLLGSAGFAFGLLNSFGLSLIALSIYRIFRSFDSAPLAVYAIFATLVAPFFWPAGFILSDVAASGLMLLSVSYFLDSLKGSLNLGALIVGSTYSLIGALFQSYSLAPIIVVLIFLVAIAASPNRKWAGFALLSSFLGLYVALSNLWALAIPHAAELDRFRLLRFSLDNLGYFVGLMGYALLPTLISFGLLASKFSLRNVRSNTHGFGTGFLILVSGGLILGAFFYQVQDSRIFLPAFSLFLPILVATLSLLSIELPITRRTSLAITVPALFFSVVLSPGNPMRPDLQEVTPFKPWVISSMFQDAKTADYLRLRDRFCEGEEALDALPSFLEDKSFGTYKKSLYEFGISNCL